MSGVSGTLTPAITRVDGDLRSVDALSAAVLSCVMAVSFSCPVGSESMDVFQESGLRDHILLRDGYRRQGPFKKRRDRRFGKQPRGSHTVVPGRRRRLGGRVRPTGN